MKNIKTYLLWWVVWIFALTWIVAWATNINNFTQTVNELDTIWASWFNSVSTRLSWTVAEGKMCTYAGWKISCMNDVPKSTEWTSDWEKNWAHINYSLWNVGVWVSSPTSKLDVAWTIKASSFIDKEESKYFLNPSDNSSIKNINTQSLSIQWTNIYDIFQTKAAWSNAIIMTFWEWEWRVDSSTSVSKPICQSWYTPKIQVSLDWIFMSWNVNSDDLIWTWYINNPSTWTIGGGNYDCGKFTWNRMTRHCWDNVKTKLSYTTYCVNEATCWASSNSTCKDGNVYNVNSCWITTTLKQTCWGLSTCVTSWNTASCYTNPVDNCWWNTWQICR